MGFYDRSNLMEGAGYYSNADFMDLVGDRTVPTLAETASFTQLALDSVAESEENWNNIMKACAYTELANYHQTGEEYVYTEASGTGFLDNVKAFFAKLWEKIKALFKKFAIFIASLTKSEKDFVTTYKKDIAKAISNIPSDAEIKGYKYTTDKAQDVVDAIAGQATLRLGSNIVKKYADWDKDDDNYDFEDVMEKVRGTLIPGNSGALNASEYSKELYSLFRNGEDSPISIDLNAQLVNESMSLLNGYDKIKNDANKVYRTCDKLIKGIDKDITKASNDLSKEFGKKDRDSKQDSNVMLIYQRSSSELRALGTILQTSNGIFLSALKEWAHQAKSVCVKVVSYKAKHEGYSFSHSEGTGFLESVVLK
jgi:hypothetical protein